MHGQVYQNAWKDCSYPRQQKRLIRVGFIVRIPQIRILEVIRIRSRIASPKIWAARRTLNGQWSTGEPMSVGTLFAFRFEGRMLDNT
jgi:hypothetical protein